jgi:hypothetical protein
MLGKQIVLSAFSAVGLSSAAIFMGLTSDATAEAACKYCERGSDIGRAPACPTSNQHYGFGASHCVYTIGSGNPPMIYCSAAGFTNCS